MMRSGLRSQIIQKDLPQETLTGKTGKKEKTRRDQCTQRRKQLPGAVKRVDLNNDDDAELKHNSRQHIGAQLGGHKLYLKRQRRARSKERVRI